MTSLSYADARLLIRPGDALFTFEPGLCSAFIRAFTGGPSHIAAGSKVSRDVTGRKRASVAQSNLRDGVHEMPTSKWLGELHRPALWLDTRLTTPQRARFVAALDHWRGCKYEDALGFIGAALGLPSDDERASNHDLICSALFAALWREATGERIPGRPWFRLAPRRPGHVYVPTPGACLDYLRQRGGDLVLLVREERPLTSRDALP